MAKLQEKFFEGCEKNGLPKDKVAKVWKDWEEFAKYAFNKSHATCYSHLSFQTAFLKTHYPAEFMAANLSHNLNDIKKITQLIGETTHMGIDVMRPDINESSYNFTVTKDGVIRFGLAAIKGVGGAAVEQVISERTENGPFTNVFDFAKRVNLKSVNKRSFEALAAAGAFDGFPDTHRAQYFHRENENTPMFIETILKHGAQFQEKQNSSQTSLFGEMEDAFEILDPVLPKAEPWTLVHKLRLEKDVTGFYISGHPLDEFKMTIDRYCNVELNELRSDMKKFAEGKNKLIFAGMVTEFQQRTSKKGDPFGMFTLEDYSGSMNFMMFKEDYLKRKHMLEVGNNIFINATVEERRHQKGNFDVRISDITLLSDAMNKLAKTLTINIDAGDIDEDLIKILAETAKENSGNCILQIKVKDTDNGDSLTMKTVKMKVEPRSFIYEIRRQSKLSYLIN